MASPLLVRGNLPARGNFFCTRRTGNIFRSLAKPRQIRDPRDVYTTTSLHKFCLSSLFPAERISNSQKSNRPTMAAYSRVNLRSTIIVFIAQKSFFSRLKIFTPTKNLSSKTMNNFYVTLSCFLASILPPFVIRNRWKLDDTYSG